MPPRPLTIFETQKYYKNEPKFNGVYLRNNLPKVNDGVYVTNLDEYKSIETHWIALNVNASHLLYFDSFAVEFIAKEIKTFIRNKTVKTNLYRIQAYNSIMCRYFYIVLIDFILKGKILLDYRNLFPPNDYEKIILKYFQKEKTWNIYI